MRSGGRLAPTRIGASLRSLPFPGWTPRRSIASWRRSRRLSRKPACSAPRLRPNSARVRRQRPLAFSAPASSRFTRRASDVRDAMASAPELVLTPAHAERGEVARLQAAASERHGPVLRGNVPSGPDAGPCLYLVGPEALELALATRVAAFSSDQGWRHVLGRGCGRAVLNTDNPEHAAERRMWAPAVSNTAIQAHWHAVNAAIEECVEA